MAVLGTLNAGANYQVRLDYPATAAGPMTWSLVALVVGGDAHHGAVAPGGVQMAGLVAPPANNVVRLMVDLWDGATAILTILDGGGTTLGQWQLSQDGSVSWVTA